MPTASSATVQTVLIVGRESVGKTQLASALTGRHAAPANFRGSTVSIDRYCGGGLELIDTPGILRSSDAETTRLALQELADHDTVLLVVQATCLDDDLHDMLPLVVGKRGLVVVTFWDKVQPGEAAQEALERLEREAGVRFLPLNAMRVSDASRRSIQEGLAEPAEFQRASLQTRVGWRIEPKPGVLEHRVWGPLLCGLLLLLPALATVFGANRLADLLHPVVISAVDPIIAWVDGHAPKWATVILTARHGDFGYGLLNMGPFLVVWALPTVLLFSLISTLYKTTGLIERINVALHPLVRPFGLSGRDIVRVMMGFGCNVPAVISTRACSSCSRSTAIAAISFGAACSYQLPATIAVLSAGAAATGVSQPVLVLSFLGYLLLTTLIYVRLTAPKRARSQLNVLMHFQRPFLHRPTLRAVWGEVRSTLRQFFLQALPVFFAICVAASLLAHLGAIDKVSSSLTPLMMVFNLPPEAAVPVVMASIRKDGIFLLTSPTGLVSPMTAVQVLTAVYLAGVLLPCLVTALQIAREIGWRQAIRLVIRQALFAAAFSAMLGWGALILVGLMG
jgi:ferrous iron transport protein B